VITEFEIKLEIPAARLAGVLAAVRRGAALRQRLRAVYFDTPEQDLARQRVVVRMRREGRRWLQAAKAPGSGPLARLEHEAEVAAPAPSGGAAPAVDLTRHAGSALEQPLRAALGLASDAAFPTLVAQYETDITRLARRVRRGRAEIEIALDQGRIVAGGQAEPVREIEFELKQGDPAALVELARRWRLKHGLWLNAISKSERGQRLAGAALAAPGAPPDPGGGSALNGAALFAATVAACLDPILTHASLLAADRGDAGDIHQLRVGIRRLRTALRELGALSDGIDPAWEPPLVIAFRELGRRRDHDRLAGEIEPRLVAAGGPAVDLGPSSAAISPPGAVVRDSDFQDVLLALIGFAHRSPGAGPGPRATRKHLRRMLARLHQQVLREGAQFTALDALRQHRVRKRLKRLRYLAEFVAPLFHRRRGRRFIDRLKPVQDALGLYNDTVFGAQTYRTLAASDPAAWFGSGWLAAQCEPQSQACEHALKALARVPVFWD
jgi:triphosphatase